MASARHGGWPRSPSVGSSSRTEEDFRVGLSRLKNSLDSNHIVFSLYDDLRGASSQSVRRRMASTQAFDVSQRGICQAPPCLPNAGLVLLGELLEICVRLSRPDEVPSRA